MNWRSLMQADSTLEKCSQNPQNPVDKRSFENIENVFAESNIQFSTQSTLIGRWIEFDSPIYGLCTGLLVLAEGVSWFVDHHSVHQTLTPIQKTWFVRVLDEPPRESR